MPDNVEHRVAMFQLAQERRKAGLPSWQHTIRLGDVWRNDAMSFEERRDEIVRRLLASPWLRDLDEYDERREVVDELSRAENVQDFDMVWSAVYDYADWDRVWIDTISGAEARRTVTLTQIINRAREALRGESDG